MVDQKLWRLGTAKAIRLLQLLFLSIALWFIYWAHIYEMIYWNKTLLETFQSNLLNILFYSILIIVVISLEFQSKRRRRISMPPSSDKTLEISMPPSVKTLETLQKENEQLKYELLKSKKIPSSKIGIALFIIGALILFASVINSSAILAFIGLGLAFWGALFLFARSTKFVRAPILDATAISPYTTLDRIIDDLNYKGKPIYIPPYPKETYLPEYLEGLKEMVVFISAKDSTTMPNIEEMAKKRFLVKKPKGICITPPGSALVSLFEKELRADFTKIDQESFYEGLPTVIINNLELASNFEIKAENEHIHLKITDSVYNYLYSKEQNLKAIHSIGCPLISAITCALAIKTGKAVTIANSKISFDLKTIEVWYRFIEG
jgi:hypothetical protein